MSFQDCFFVCSQFCLIISSVYISCLSVDTVERGYRNTNRLAKLQIFPWNTVNNEHNRLGGVKMDMHHLRKKSARAIAEINFSSSVCCQRGETRLSLGLESCIIQRGETNSIWPPEWVIKQQSSSPCCSSEETATVSPHVERQLFHECLPLCFQLSQDLDRQKERWGMKSRQRRRQGDPQIHVPKGRTEALLSKSNH